MPPDAPSAATPRDPGASPGSPRRAGKSSTQGKQLADKQSRAAPAGADKELKITQVARERSDGQGAPGAKKNMQAMFKEEAGMYAQPTDKLGNFDHHPDKQWQQRSELDSGHNEAHDDHDHEENYEYDEDELDNWGSDMEMQERPNCLSKCLRKIKADYMIDPDNKKLRAFHLIVALTFYMDVIVTSLMIGNYDY